ncbi:MAG: flavodoxin domain-containing protein [Planctomycetota bacterium]|nr:flavodoxin domain-containing protein [Planctomycetota bacterium]
MPTAFKAIQICEDVYWVGAIDWTLRDFHGYSTSRGSTYNAFLIMADKVTLIDTVKAPFKHEMMSRIASVIDPSKIDYIVSHHTEMDHSGSLPEVVDEVKPEKLFASRAGAVAMKQHFHRDLEPVAVADGEDIALGQMKLTFFDTKMLHWPESIVSYLHERKVLFSQDIFGLHLASSERFDDELPEDILYFEAAKYYANIVMPYSPLVKKLLKKVEGLGVEFDMIAPDHGPIWRTNPTRIIKWYHKWAEMKPENKAVIIYDTMWKSCRKMAASIADGLAQEGVSAKVLEIGSTNRSEVATELLECGAIIVGSPTINNNIFPSVADVLTYAKGLKPRNLVGAVFATYGWSGEAVNHLEAVLEEMKVEKVAESVNIQYVPDDAALEKCRELGLCVARSLKEKLQVE